MNHCIDSNKSAMMGKPFFFRSIIFLILVFLIFSGESFSLSLKDVRPTMEKIFTYHIENKTFSPTIARRSLKVYIEHFDPHHLYLFKEEVDPYLDASSNKIEEIIDHYYQDQFFDYCALNAIIAQAILRAQSIRHQQIDRILCEGEEGLQSFTPSSYSHYPSNEQELKDRIYERLVLEVQSYLQSHKNRSVNVALMKQILHHYSNKVVAFEREYLDQTEHAMALHVIKAMAKCLDPHTGYYSPKEATAIRTMLKKELSGIGVGFREDCDGIYVTHIIPSGPAYKSGMIQVGDLLVSVNHRLVDGMTFAEFLDLVQGKVGSAINLGIKRNEEIMHIDLIRQKIVIDNERISFSHEPYGDGIIGKIVIPTFYDNGGKINVASDLKEALRSLKKKGNLKGIVLDFRENSGGFLQQAIKVSSLFIRGGLIVISKYADGEISYAQDVDGRQFFDGPILILISKASASAAEIVAQSLQDYGVALIVGDKRSYGKGTIQLQTLTDENSKTFFKVTVGRYYTPSGRSPQIAGVQGGIFVPTSLHSYNIGEKYLEFSLPNDHLSGDIFYSLLPIKGGSYRNPSHSFVPYLKPCETKWRHMLPTLIKNSQQRLDKNPNYQLFIKMGQENCLKKERGNISMKLLQENYGVNDLQLEESMKIVKDMIFLDREKSLR